MPDGVPGPDGPPAPMTGLSHVQLNVTDVAASARWYTATLGLEPFASDPENGYIALRHRPSRIVIVLTEGAGTDDLPSGSALDHLAFAVPDAASLQGWADHLAAVGIEHPGIVDELGNQSLQLRDPDGNAIELAAPGSQSEPKPGT
jgi:glyoxylase I family protein